MAIKIDDVKIIGENCIEYDANGERGLAWKDGDKFVASTRSIEISEKFVKTVTEKVSIQPDKKKEKDDFSF